MVLVQREDKQAMGKEQRAPDTRMELWGVAEKGEQFTAKGKSIKNGARKMGDTGNENTVFLSHTVLKFYLTPERVKCQVPSLEHLIMRTSF